MNFHFSSTSIRSKTVAGIAVVALSLGGLIWAANADENLLAFVGGKPESAAVKEEAVELATYEVADAVAEQDDQPAPLKNTIGFTFVLKRADADAAPLEEGEILNSSAIRAGLVAEFTLADNAPDDVVGGVFEVFANDRLVGRSEKVASKTQLPRAKLSELASQLDEELRFTAHWVHDDKISKATDSLTFKVDARGPAVERVYAVTQPDLSSTNIYIQFVDSDVKFENNALEGVILEKLNDRGEFRPVPASLSAVRTENKLASISLTSPSPGVYRVTLKGTGNEPVITDINGNRLLEDLTRAGLDFQETVVIAPEAKKGGAVEFPEFLPALPQPATQRRINPSDKVTTAVVRLYYFRDAHRVAQIINREVESLNGAAVTLAEQRADGSRRRADDLTDERRAKERQAVRDAEDLRRAERDLEDFLRNQKTLTQDLNARENIINDDIERITAKLGSINTRLAEISTTSGNTSERSRLQEQKRELELTADQLKREKLLIANEHTRLQQSVGGRTEEALRTEVNRLRNVAAASNEAAIATQAKEDRAHEQAYRDHVAALKADPDTYAAGRITSVDPIAQVSVTVIGEGVLHLRGPQKGIDRIKTLVHQIDSPLGQVKVDVITVQVNGENAKRLERPVGRIESHLTLGRFLTTQSLMLLKQAIQEEATRIALEHDQEGRYQVDRDRKYMYAFFGQDFVDELYELDSEFLRSENKLLSLHSMDTVNVHQALFILALARNDVRQRILVSFMEKVRSDLVQAEYDFRRSSELPPHRTHAWLPRHEHPHLEAETYEAVMRQNHQRYHFTNLLNFFGYANLEQCAATAGAIHDPTGRTMTPMQREFIRLAQIFKARLVSELELKQRIIERAMIEDARYEDILAEEEARISIRADVLQRTKELNKRRLTLDRELITAATASQAAIARVGTAMEGLAEYYVYIVPSRQRQEQPLPPRMMSVIDRQQPSLIPEEQYPEMASIVKEKIDLDPIARAAIATIEKAKNITLSPPTDGKNTDTDGKNTDKAQLNAKILSGAARLLDEDRRQIEKCREHLREAIDALSNKKAHFEDFIHHIAEARAQLRGVQNEAAEDARQALERVSEVGGELFALKDELARNKDLEQLTRRSLEKIRLLDFLIEEQEQRYIDLLEGTRAHISTMDGYLKNLSIALEDDFKVQFYDVAFQRIRGAAREWDVTFGQVERTSVVTNNRALAVVQPQATMEFDLPNRKIAVIEAFDAAKALTQDYGALLTDPTFLAAAKLMGAAPSNGKVQNVLPGLDVSRDEQQMLFSKAPREGEQSALEQLVPDPSIYKIETGTGYTIRPVIQPDGNSIVYDFHYMYTTEIREPVRADEKHLGRVRRHFLTTQVQTGNFELRELSRYQVALKAAKTRRGVPMLENIPVVGAAFRPLPSAEASIQQNIILAQSTVYPTLFDLMGLRWAPSVVDLDHLSVRDWEHVTRGRYDVLSNGVFEFTTDAVDDVLGFKEEFNGRKDFYRPDLYHRQTKPSPYHPGGYRYREMSPEEDPTGEGFEKPDRRPMEQREPPYDRRYRKPIRLDGNPGGAPTYDYEAINAPSNTARATPPAPRTSQTQQRTAQKSNAAPTSPSARRGPTPTPPTGNAGGKPPVVRR